MLKLEKKELCCGCTACANVCPKNCISMKADEEGFLYPVVNKERCVHCGICEKRCPMNGVKKQNPIIEAYVIRCIDKGLLIKATSGGVSTVIADTFYNNGNDVFGVKFDDSFEAIHAVAQNKEDIHHFVGSKYVQSNMNSTISEINHLLNCDRKVLFIGTPCQVAAVSNCVHNDKNLYLIDFVCRAVPSPSIWRDYIKNLSQIYKSQVANAVFREKTYGYHNSAMCVYFANGKKYCKSGRTDVYHKLFFEGLSIRQSCEQCSFRSENRCSDMTMLEAWHAQRNLGMVKDDNKGYGTVLIRTRKGKELINESSAKLYINTASSEQILKDDAYYLTNSIKRNTDRALFFETYTQHGLSVAAKKYVTITLADRLFEIIKPILYKSGILIKLKKMKRLIKNN